MDKIDLAIEKENEDLWHWKMSEILRKNNRPKEEMYFTRGPAQLANYLYLGDCSDADSHGLLQDLGITHVLNCAGSSSNQYSAVCPYGGNTGVRSYMQLDADDHSNYQIRQHFTECKEFIDRARAQNGRALVYCVKGINRSAAVCVAYLMADQGMDLLDAVLCVSRTRGRILTNEGFRRQLVQFAQATNRLGLS